MKTLFKFLLGSLLVVLLLGGLTVATFFHCMEKGGIFGPAPYVATECAGPCNLSQFVWVRVGMRKAEVEALLGKPLYYENVGPRNAPGRETKAAYARKKRPWAALISWRSYDVFYDSHGVVVATRSRWWDESDS